jgi:subtilisin family serine protease
MKEKLFAQIAIVLLLLSIFAALPVASAPLMFTEGKITAIPLDVAGADPVLSPTDGNPGGKKPKPTFNLDMIDVENVAEDGEGVYVAVIDTGMLPNWEAFFPAEKIATEWATAFFWDEYYNTIEVPEYWDQALSGHGTHVASTVIGYNYIPNWHANAVQEIDGVAPGATIIPIKALWWFDEYGTSVGTWDAIATAIDYVTSLAIEYEIEMVINLSLGGGSPAAPIEAAIDAAIAAGVIVVAAAGNAGSDGMDWPGAYPQVISAAWAGWTGQWFGGFDPVTYDPLWDEDWHRNDVPEDLMTPPPSSMLFGSWGGTQVYMSWGSGRELEGQDLDVAAPGSWVYGPYWTPLWGPLPEQASECYGWVGGTSMASPHVAGTAALMLEKNPTLGQFDIEMILEATADLAPITYPNGGVIDPNPYMAIYALHWGYPPGWYYSSWADDAVGEGFLDADSAVAAA